MENSWIRTQEKINFLFKTLSDDEIAIQFAAWAADQNPGQFNGEMLQGLSLKNIQFWRALFKRSPVFEGIYLAHYLL